MSQELKIQNLFERLERIEKHKLLIENLSRIEKISEEMKSIEKYVNLSSVYEQLKDFDTSPNLDEDEVLMKANWIQQQENYINETSQQFSKLKTLLPTLEKNLLHSLNDEQKNEISENFQTLNQLNKLDILAFQNDKKITDLIEGYNELTRIISQKFLLCDEALRKLNLNLQNKLV